jgi:hypothetical protein
LSFVLSTHSCFSLQNWVGPHCSHGSGEGEGQVSPQSGVKMVPIGVQTWSTQRAVSGHSRLVVQPVSPSLQIPGQVPPHPSDGLSPQRLPAHWGTHEQMPHTSPTEWEPVLAGLVSQMGGQHRLSVEVSPKQGPLDPQTFPDEQVKPEPQGGAIASHRPHGAPLKSQPVWTALVAHAGSQHALTLLGKSK